MWLLTDKSSWNRSSGAFRVTCGARVLMWLNRTGSIPNYGAEGLPRPTHVTTVVSHPLVPL